MREESRQQRGSSDRSNVTLTNGEQGSRIDPGAAERGDSRSAVRRWGILAGCAAVALVGYALLFAPSPPDGPAHPRYDVHVENVATQIAVSDEDVDQATTDAVREALAENAPVPVTAELSPGLKRDIAAGDARFYLIHLFDNCDEDGDVVRVLVNGLPVGEVPITHAGTTLSVPFTAGQTNTVSIMGVHDGGGGITLGLRTSEGRYYTRILQEGEFQELVAVTQ